MTIHKAMGRGFFALMLIAGCAGGSALSAEEAGSEAAVDPSGAVVEPAGTPSTTTATTSTSPPADTGVYTGPPPTWDANANPEVPCPPNAPCSVLTFVAVKGAADANANFSVYANANWLSPMPGVKRAIIVQHGLGSDANNYLLIMTKAVKTLGDPNTTSVLILAPMFATKTSNTAQQLPAGSLYWSTDGWEGGDLSISASAISSFTALDAVVTQLLDKAHFPALERVIVAGHSGGGQTVQRYAIVGQGLEWLRQAGMPYQVIVANPSSYMYFDTERPTQDPNTFAVFDANSCPNYNTWKYGVESPLTYAGDMNFAAQKDIYAKRPVAYLLGELDNDPNNGVLDKSCAGEAQGPHRLFRGEAYYGHLQHIAPGNVHTLCLVPNVGHDGMGMFGSACAAPLLH